MDLLTETCTETCPVARAATVLSGKWTTLIFRELLGGTKRYSQLQAALEHISPKVLADRLRYLEAEGLVRRDLFPTIPPRTEYSLTATGRRIEPVIHAMAEFGAMFQPTNTEETGSETTRCDQPASTCGTDLYQI